MSLIFQTPLLPGQALRHGIYVGGRDDAKDLKRLKDRSITHILNLTPPKEVNIQAGVPNFFETSLTYKRIPIYDSTTSVPLLNESSHEIIDFIRKGLCHGSVLVHCQKGISRSVTAVAAYLITCEHMTLSSAMDLIRRRRPEAQPIPAFMEWLNRLEQQKPNDSQQNQQAQTAPTVPRPPILVGPQRPPKRSCASPSSDDDTTDSTPRADGSTADLSTTTTWQSSEDQQEPKRQRKLSEDRQSDT